MSDYLFIDGAYLRERFKACIRDCYEIEVPLWPDGMTDALESSGIRNRNLQKVFYYVCVPATEGLDSENDNTEQGKLISTILSTPGWHFREGLLAGTRKEKKRSQKRVDVLLTVGMLSHAIAKNMDRAILIAGDDDFTPLVAELLRHGTYVEVWSDRKSQSRYLEPTKTIVWISVFIRISLHLTSAK